MNNDKDNIELLLYEGIEFLNSQIDRFELGNDNKNNTLKDYILKYSPLSTSERIDKMLKGDKNNIYEEVISVFNNINNFMYDKKEILNIKKMATVKELQILFNEYTNMLESNLNFEDLDESFLGWCEGGEVFYTHEPKISDHSIGICTLLMNHYAEKLDSFTYKLSEIYENEIEKEKNEESEDEEL